jgi:hypothetical protein
VRAVDNQGRARVLARRERHGVYFYSGSHNTVSSGNKGLRGRDPSPPKLSVAFRTVGASATAAHGWP